MHQWTTPVPTRQTHAPSFQCSQTAPAACVDCRLEDNEHHSHFSPLLYMSAGETRLGSATPLGGQKGKLCPMQNLEAAVP